VDDHPHYPVAVHQAVSHRVMRVVGHRAASHRGMQVVVHRAVSRRVMRAVGRQAASHRGMQAGVPRAASKAVAVHREVSKAAGTIALKVVLRRAVEADPREAETAGMAEAWRAGYPAHPFSSVRRRVQPRLVERLQGFLRAWSFQIFITDIKYHIL
jgi:hypothetical protein